MSNIHFKEKELSELKQKSKNYLTQLDELYIMIEKLMPEEASSWIDKYLEATISKNSKLIQSMDEETLSEIKKKIAQLKSNLSQLVTVAFKDKSKWLHRIENEDIDKGFRNKSTEVHYIEVFRNIIGNFGSILNEYKFIDLDLAWEKLSNGKIRYAINPGYGYDIDPNVISPSEEIRKSYSQLYIEYRELLKKIEYAQKELSEFIAKEKWNNV